MAELVYDHDGVELWHGDNSDVRPEPADVDLLLTDPPYGIDLDTEGAKQEAAKHYRAIANDDRAFDPRWMLDHEKCIIWGANNFASLLPDHGSWIVWDKVTKNGLNLRIAEAELAWTNFLGRTMAFRHMWSGAFRDSERGVSLHPSQKPVELMRWIVDRWTEPGDLVYDPYMGSGPVAQACADLGRRYIGVELEREYVDAAVGRLSQQTLALA